MGVASRLALNSARKWILYWWPLYSTVAWYDGKDAISASTARLG